MGKCIIVLCVLTSVVGIFCQETFEKVATIGFTDHQKDLLETTWNIVNASHSEFSTNVLKKMLVENYVELKDTFHELQNMSINEMQASEVFSTQASVLSYTLEFGYHNLTKNDETFESIGDFYNRIGLHRIHVLKLQSSIIHELRKCLGNTFTSEVEDVWTNFLRNIFKFIVNGFHIRT